MPIKQLNIFSDILDLKVIISDKYKTTFNYIFNKQKITNCVVINNSLDITYISLAQGIHYDKTSNGWNFIFQQNRKFFMLLFKLKINTTDYIITLCEDNIIFKKINQYFKDKLYNFLHNIDFDGIFNKICNNDMLYNNNFIYYFYKAYSYYTYIINDIMSKMKNISLKGYKFADDISTLISDKSKQLITDRIQLAKKIIQEYFINNNITIAQINKLKYKKELEQNYDKFIDTLTDIYDVLEQYSILPNDFYRIIDNNYNIQVKNIIDKQVSKVRKLVTLGKDENGKLIRRYRKIDVFNEIEKPIHYLYHYNNKSLYIPLDNNIVKLYNEFKNIMNKNSIKSYCVLNNNTYLIMIDRDYGNILECIKLN
jgi:hypothetical protein